MLNNPEKQVKAWVNFNGQGTVAIRKSENVTSITDNGTGDYTVNLTNAMIDANFAILASAKNTLAIGTANFDVAVATTNNSASAPRVQAKNTSGTLSDAELFNVAIIR